VSSQLAAFAQAVFVTVPHDVLGSLEHTLSVLVVPSMVTQIKGEALFLLLLTLTFMIC
jgi:hypothetical protein